MGIQAITLSNSASTPISLIDDNGDHIQGLARIFNPVDSAGRVAVHQNGAAGVTPVTETHSTASLTVVTETTPGAVTVPAGARFVDDAGKFWDADIETVSAAATAGTGEATLTGDTSSGAVHVPAGSRICKTGEETGPFWATDDDVDLTPATYSTAVERFTIDNDGQAVTIPADTLVEKAAGGAQWGTDEESVTPSATPSTADVTLVGAQNTVYPIATVIAPSVLPAETWLTDAEAVIENGVTATPSVAVVQFAGAQGTVYPAAQVVHQGADPTDWTTDAEAEITNGVTATYGTVEGVEVVGTPATVIPIGTRICAAADVAAGPYWAAAAEITIGGTGIGHGDFTCATIGAVPALAGALDTIKDAVAGWSGVENDADAVPGLDAADGTVQVGITCSENGPTAVAIGSLDTAIDAPVGHTAVGNPEAGTEGTDAADGSVVVGVTYHLNGLHAAAPGAIDTVADAPAGHTSATNILAATLGLPIIATVDLAVTCTTIGDEAALAGTLDTLVAPVANVSTVTNPADATVGTTEAPTANVGITCLTKDAIAADAATLDHMVDVVSHWTAVTNAAPVTPGVAKDHTETIAVTAVLGGVVNADTGEITSLEVAITGVVSITNAAPATPGVAGVAGSAVDFTLPPGAGHPFDGQIATMQGKSLTAAPIVVQLLTGADALQEDITTLTGVEVDVDLDMVAANAAHLATSPVLRVQHLGPTGDPAPAGDDPARPVHGQTVGPTTGAETLYAELAGNGASQAALPANAARKKACIVNASTSTGPLWIGEGVTAEANKGTRVDPNGCYNWDSTNPFYGAINVYAAVGVIIGRSEA